MGDVRDRRLSGFPDPRRPLRRVSIFFASRRRHTRSDRDWSSDVCSSDLAAREVASAVRTPDYAVALIDGSGRVLLNTAVDLRVPGPPPPDSRRAITMTATDEIGRASCRERV